MLYVYFGVKILRNHVRSLQKFIEMFVMQIVFMDFKFLVLKQTYPLIVLICHEFFEISCL